MPQTAPRRGKESPTKYLMGISRSEAALWVLAASAIILINLVLNEGLRYTNDSFQYLSAAENLRAGDGVSTNLVHFDIERSHGELPAPMTSFPFGYPIAIAAVSLLGLSGWQAAGLVSTVSFLVLVPIVLGCGVAMGISRNGLRLVLLLLITNQAAARHQIYVLSEPLFTLLMTGTVYLVLIASSRLDSRISKSRALVIAGVLAGLSCWVRYAGLFLLAAILSFYGLQVLTRRTGAALKDLALVSVGVPIVAVGLLRNVLIAGTWMGGNDKPVDNSLVDVLARVMSSIYQLLFGGRSSSAGLARVDAVISVSILILAVLLLVATWRRRSSPPDRPSLAVILVVCVVAVYTMAMVYAGLVTPIAVYTRVFYPLLPLVLLLGVSILEYLRRGVVESERGQRLLWVGVALLCFGSVWANTSHWFSHQPTDSPEEALALRFDQPTDAGHPLSDWFEQNIPPDAVLTATDGQLTGHALRRSTLSLVERRYSTVEWTEQQVREQMITFNSDYLVLYPNGCEDECPAQSESVFLRSLLEGRNPDWLELIESNAEVLVFRTTSE